MGLDYAQRAFLLDAIPTNAALIRSTRPLVQRNIPLAADHAATGVPVCEGQNIILLTRSKPSELLAVLFIQD